MKKAVANDGLALEFASGGVNVFLNRLRLFF